MRNTKKYSSFLSRLDWFGKTFEFNLGGQKEFRSSFGGIFSLFIFSIVLYTIYTFGKEIIIKDHPQLLILQEGSKKRQNLTLNLPIAFTIEDNTGVMIDDYTKYVSFFSYRTNITWVDDLKIMTVDPVPMHICKPEEFRKENRDDFDFDLLHYAHCIDNTQKIGGFQDISYNVFLTVNVQRCRNSSKISDFQKKGSTGIDKVCASDEEINKFLSRNDIQMTIYFEELIFQPYSFANPVSYYITEEFYAINPEFCLLSHFFMQEFVVTTDKGWLVPDESSISLQKVDSRKSMYYHTKDMYSECIMNTSFYTSEYVQKNHRSYDKLPIIMALLGGLIKVIYTFFDSFLVLIYRRKMNEMVLGSLFQISNRELEEEDLKEMENLQKLKTIKTLKKSKTLKAGNLDKQKIMLPNRKSISKFAGIDESGNINDNTKGKILGQENSNINSHKKGDKSVDTMREKEEENYNVDDDEIIGKDHVRMLEMAIAKWEKANSREEEGVETGFSISLMEHFVMLICPMFGGNLLRKKKEIFIQLEDYCLKYTDVLNFTGTINEVVKLKYVMLNPKQLAVFNMISPPENPAKTEKIKNKVSILYKYSMDSKRQVEEAKRFLNQLKEGKRKTNIDYKILDLLDEK